MPEKPVVLIVGAGPTGLTAALELARRGFVPRVVDRDNGPTPLSKAAGISPHSLELLEASGVTSRLLDRGIKVRHGHVHASGRELGTLDFSALRHRFNFLLALPQHETEAIMSAVLTERSVAVDWRTKLVRLVQSDSAVEATLDGPRGREVVRADIVFGADGPHSTTREALGISFDGYTHARQWSIADADIADWPYEADAAQVFFYKNGDVGFIIPIGNDRFRAVSNTGDALSRVPGGYRVTNLIRADEFSIPVRQAARYQKGRVFLGGDAAHVHSPLGARGMNLGIEDASAFARRLAENELDGYTAERQPVGKRWIELSERLLGAAEATNPLVQTARNVVLGIVGNLPALQRPMLQRAAGLKE